MSLKLKLKVSSKPRPDDESESEKPLPKIRIKPPKLEPSDSVAKPKVKKEKLKKLKINLSRASLQPSESDHPVVQPKPLIYKKVPKVRIKPTRIPGEGYDSEAPDLEDDPLIEQGIVVRFAQDANLDFVHHAVDTGDFSNLNIKWITRDKAVVNVNLTLYSARLLDLPTITEVYKTIDKKNIFKSLDVCQVLLVLHQINPKQLNMETDFEVPRNQTYMHPLYKLSPNKEIRPTKMVYKHGLAYAFEDAYRRLKPRKVNHRLMVDVDLRVDELVKRDAEAQESHYEYVDPRTRARTPTSTHPSTSSMPALPAPPLIQEPEEDEIDIEEDLDNVLEQELAEVLGLTSNNSAATVLMKAEYNDDDDDDGDDDDDDDDNDNNDDDDDDDEDDDDNDDNDDNVKEDKLHVKKLEEEIADLARAADKQKVLMASASFKMMRMKFQLSYNNLKSQLDLKKRELAKVMESQRAKEEQEKSKLATAVVRNEDGDGDEGNDDNDENDENIENDDNGGEEMEIDHHGPPGVPAAVSEEAEGDANAEDEADDGEGDIDDFGDLF